MRIRKHGGFTLIEVVVAMAILGISLVVIIELFSGGLRLGRASEEYTKATQYARLKMEEISLTDQMEEGIEEGEFDSTYRWKVDARRIDLLPAETATDYRPPADLYLIQIEILWKSGNRERVTRLETFKTIKPETDVVKTS